MLRFRHQGTLSYAPTPNPNANPKIWHLPAGQRRASRSRCEPARNRAQPVGLLQRFDKVRRLGASRGLRLQGFKGQGRRV